MNLFADIVRDSLQAQSQQEQNQKLTLDDVKGKLEEDHQPKDKSGKDDKTSEMTADAVQTMRNNMAIHQERQIAGEALSMFADWINTEEDELPEGDGYGDHLYSLMISLADDNKDGEISEDEADIISAGLEALAEYAISKGIDEKAIVDLLSDFDNDLALNVREMLLGEIPDDEDELQDELDRIVFSESENEVLLDSVAITELDEVAENEDMTLDAAYRKKFVIRNGKKKRINKRISGRVVLSAKRKAAIRKAQRKAWKGSAKIKRLKSFRLRKRLGL